MTLGLVFEITLLSDYHVGAGHGLGMLVDSALQRDPDGRPTLPGTTLAGLLREGLQQLLAQAPVARAVSPACQASGLEVRDETPRYCGQHDPGQGDCPVCTLFGSPRTRRHWEISTARPAGEDLPAATGGDERWAAGRTAATIAPHVRVSPRTRRAEARKLFFREEGDERLKLTFTVTGPAASEAMLDEAAWIAAAGCFVTHLGAARRRGRGECRFRVVDVTGVELPAGCDAQTWLLDRFASATLGQPAPAAITLPAAAPSVKLVQGSRDAGSSYTVRKRVIAWLCEPLIVSERAEAGNEYRAADIIPGTTVRGAFAGLAAAAHDLANQQGDDYAAFVELFFRGAAQFGALLPARLATPTDLYPAIPAPFDLLSCELHPGYGPVDAAEHGARGFAVATEDEALDAHCAVCGESKVDLKPLEGYLPLRTGGKPFSLGSRRVSQMHVRIDPQSGRADAGALYGIDALAPGLYFVGALNFADQEAWHAFSVLVGLPATPGHALTVRLGKASRRGYGEAVLWIEDAPEDEAGHEALDPWIMAPLETRVPDLTRPITLTCLTDTIVVDRWGRYETGFGEHEKTWLAQLLDLPVRVMRSYSGTRTIDSYNAHVGLPRTREVALRAGSAVGLQIVGPLDDEGRNRVLARMAELELVGMGLRTNEGFGRIAFNHPVYDGCQAIGDRARISLRRRPALRRQVDGDPTGLRAEQSFADEWQDVLDEEKRLKRLFRAPEFAALAHALRRTASAPGQSVETLLGQLGRLEALPAGQTWDDLAVWRKNKEPLAFYYSDPKQPAEWRVLLQDLLKQLEESAQGDAQRRRLGLLALADRIAATARAAEKEGTDGSTGN